MPLGEQIAHKQVACVESLLRKIIWAGGLPGTPGVRTAIEAVGGIEPAPVPNHRGDIGGDRRRRTGTPPDTAHIRTGRRRIHSWDVGTEGFQSEECSSWGVPHRGYRRMPIRVAGFPGLHAVLNMIV